MDQLLSEAKERCRLTCPEVLRAAGLWLVAGGFVVLAHVGIDRTVPPDRGLLHVMLEIAVYGVAAVPFIVASAMDRRTVERRYRRTRDTLTDVVEHSGDLIFTLDWDGRWTWVNAAAERVLGEPPAALLGRPFSERTAPSHLKEEMAAFRRMLRGEEYHDFETVHLDPAGREVVLSISARARRDARGALAGVQGIAHDISQRAAAMDALLEAHEAAAEATRAKASFMANVSHEIRTPMHGVLGTTRLLLDMPLDPEHRRLAEIIRESGESLLAVIDQVLDFSKLEAGRVELEDVVFALPEAVESVVRLFAAEAEERGIALFCAVEPGVPALVSGDPGRLRQVLANLAGNALKFTPRGGMVEVLVSAETPDGGVPHVRFSVRDTGVGIAPDRLARVFDAFEQGDSSTSRRYGGSGLGLAIARQIVEAMAGQLAVVSSPGEGSTFTFAAPLRRLPGEKTYASARRRSAASLVAADRPAGGSGSAEAEPSPRRILVVDDNMLNRFIAVRMLRARGHEVEEAASGRRAIAAAAAQPFDLIFMDVQMPDLDGLAATKAIRDDGLTVPIVALTSHAFADERTRCLEIGMNDVLTKPYTPDALFAMVARWAAPSQPVVPAGTPSGAVADVTGVDLEGLRATLRQAGIASLFDDLVSGFRRDAPGRMDAIEVAAAARDATALARAAHAYKGSAGAVAAHGLATALSRLEAAGRTGDLDAVPTALAGVHAAHACAMHQLATVTSTHAEGAEAWSGSPLIAAAG